jgi:hypothetical protein
MFHDWENFYLIVGPSAAALIGLLFVVVTLTSGQDRSKALWGQSLFMTPIVFHYGVVLVLSAMAGAPDLHRPAISAMVGITALFGFVYCVRNVLAMRRRNAEQPPHWSDIYCYGYGPALFYVLLATSAPALWRGLWFAEHLLAATLMGLLLLSIRNSWDLITWLAPRAGDETAP